MNSSNIPFFCAYAGTSMNPTLCELDLLEIVPYGKRPIRVGDVILFLPPEGAEAVIHRIVNITSKGIRTRGDNNLHDDPYFLLPQDIAGRVVAAWRGQKCQKIAGGWIGWLLAHLIRRLYILDRKVSLWLHPIYHSFAQSGIIYCLLPSRLKPRVVIFKSNGSNCVQLLLGRRVLGRYNTRRHQWNIRRPFRLFIDERMLSKLQATKTITSLPVDGHRCERVNQ